ERQQATSEHARHEYREGDAPERLLVVGAEVAPRLLQCRVHGREARPDDDGDVRDVERYVGDDYRREPGNQSHVQYALERLEHQVEEGSQRHALCDVGDDDRQVEQSVEGFAPGEAAPGQCQSQHRAHDGRQHGGNPCYQQGVAHGSQEQAGLEPRRLGAGRDGVFEDVLVPHRREAVPHRHRGAVVEREDHQDDYGDPQEQVDEERAEPQSDLACPAYSQVAAEALPLDDEVAGRRLGCPAASRTARRSGSHGSSCWPHRVYTSTPTKTTTSRTIDIALPSGMLPRPPYWLWMRLPIISPRVPPIRSGVTKAPMAGMNTRMQPATTPGSVSGKMTRQNERQSLAPRS